MSNSDRNLTPQSVAGGGAAAMMPAGPVRSPEQLIDELSSFLSGQGAPDRVANNNEPPHARAYNVDDEEIDDVPMPIPSTWLAEPERPAEKGWFAEQAWAAALGFVVGLIIVIPAILFLTARFGELTPGDSTSPSARMPLVAQAGLGGGNEVVPAGATGASVEPAATETVSAASGATPSEPAAPAPMPVPTARISEQDAGPAVASSAEPPASLTPSDTPAGPVAMVPSTAGAAPRVAAAPKVESGSGETPTVAVVRVKPIKTVETRQPSEPERAPPPLTDRLPTLESAKRDIQSGKIEQGRRALAQLASSGDADAVFALAETYDPNMLAAWSVANVAADPAKARLFYGMALSRGLEPARQRLKALD